MDTFNYLGSILADKINKTEITAKGIIRMAIKDEYKDPFVELNSDEWVNVFKNNLKRKLELIKISDSDEVVEYMIYFIPEE
ncbi:MAG: hypothetical protein GY870_09680 [archaeon]|nr:hypothetical protein [archaeon]